MITEDQAKSLELIHVDCPNRKNFNSPGITYDRTINFSQFGMAVFKCAECKRPEIWIKVAQP